MSYKPEHKHLTVLGFAGQKSNSAIAKAGKATLKEAKKKTDDADKEVSVSVSDAIEALKTEFKDDLEGFNKASHDLMEKLKKK